VAKPCCAGAIRRVSTRKGAAGAYRSATAADLFPEMTSTPRFAGRRALVTGASRGIGAGIARRLAAEGADVAIVARTAKRHPTLPGSLLATARAMESSGGNVVRIVADLADQSDHERIIAEATEGLGGPIEILVNNAAAAIYQPMADYPARRIRLTMAVNVEAPFALMRGSSQR
jgi:citronellol/citronellal dehydrogenase